MAHAKQTELAATSSPAAATKPEVATPMELAMLAALLDPAGCRSGNARDALFRAVALFQESAALCDEMAGLDGHGLMGMLRDETWSNNGGAHRLHETLIAIARRDSASALTLALKDEEPDTLRPYLAEHCNLEGKSQAGRKSWSRVRSVLENFEAWHIDTANSDNLQNAARIRERDLRDEEQARARGCTVEQLLSGGSAAYRNEQWQDWEQNWQDFLSRHAVQKEGRITGYRIPREIVDRFIVWKRAIRQKKGGMTSVRPLTRAEVLAEPVKKKNPKR